MSKDFEQGFLRAIAWVHHGDDTNGMPLIASMEEAYAAYKRTHPDSEPSSNERV